MTPGSFHAVCSSWCLLELQYPEDADNFLPNYTVLHPRQQQCSYSLMSEPQILQEPIRLQKGAFLYSTLDEGLITKVGYFLWVVNTMSSHSSDRLFRTNYTDCSCGAAFKITSLAAEVTCARYLYSAAISFNLLLRLLGIRVCLLAESDKKQTSLMTYRRVIKLLFLHSGNSQSLHGANPPNRIYNFPDDKHSKSVETKVTQ